MAKKFKVLILILITFLLSSNLLFSAIESLKTPVELSDFQRTSTYRELMEYIYKLKEMSNDMKILIIGNSYEGHPIPLVVLAKPVFQFPSLAKKTGKTTILINANIHGGEVEGKEASLILMREILLGELNYLLEKEVILIIPIFNIDGNDKIDPSHRPYQNGPSQGVGIRHNGQNLDLNRDFIKIESPEVKSLINVLNKWDPDVFIDLHTTNGSYHQEPLTYSGATNPNGDLKVLEYTRDKLLPTVAKKLKEKHGYLSIPYGNFADRTAPEKGWIGFEPVPRMGVNYVGLRNRISILNENYAYAPYKVRIFACKGFLQSILEYCYEHCSEIRRLIDDADKRTIEQIFS
ncbi:M14 family metallopeptidase [Candidatus Aminicenantes bacterium AC-335-O07]|nr:M14 family metallopeptidase [Candidatus Aminicenantes bacterium AC-335-O07]